MGPNRKRGGTHIRIGRDKGHRKLQHTIILFYLFLYSTQASGQSHQSLEHTNTTKAKQQMGPGLAGQNNSELPRRDNGHQRTRWDRTDKPCQLGGVARLNPSSTQEAHNGQRHLTRHEARTTTTQTTHNTCQRCNKPTEHYLKLTPRHNMRQAASKRITDYMAFSLQAACRLHDQNQS